MFYLHTLPTNLCVETQALDDCEHLQAEEEPGRVGGSAGAAGPAGRTQPQRPPRQEGEGAGAEEEEKGPAAAARCEQQ